MAKNDLGSMRSFGSVQAREMENGRPGTIGLGFQIVKLFEFSFWTTIAFYAGRVQIPSSE